ncbi:hypothetical protein Tco_0507276, partial [Tanacetum coccineum]
MVNYKRVMESNWLHLKPVLHEDKLVYGNWEILKGKFMEMIEWFYMGYLKQEVLGELPPIIG